MPNKIDSPFKEYPGYIILPDGLLWSQKLMLGDAIAENQLTSIRPTINDLRICANSIDAVNNIVEWHIDSLPSNPNSPRPTDIFNNATETLVACQFYTWVYEHVKLIWLNANSVPKVPSSGPTDMSVTPTAAAKKKDKKTEA